MRKELNKLGIRIEPNADLTRVNAPILNIDGYELKFTLDHISRKLENPLQAFDAVARRDSN